MLKTLTPSLRRRVLLDLYLEGKRQIPKGKVPWSLYAKSRFRRGLRFAELEVRTTTERPKARYSDRQDFLPSFPIHKI